MNNCIICFPANPWDFVSAACWLGGEEGPQWQSLLLQSNRWNSLQCTVNMIVNTRELQFTLRRRCKISSDQITAQTAQWHHPGLGEERAERYLSSVTFIPKLKHWTWYLQWKQQWKQQWRQPWIQQWRQRGWGGWQEKVPQVFIITIKQSVHIIVTFCHLSGETIWEQRETWWVII